MRLKKWTISLLFFAGSVLAGCLLLTSCASSDLSRDAANQVDDVYSSASGSNQGADPIGLYHTATQATKGAIVGGAAGAVTGSLVNGIGTIPGAIGGAVFGAALGAYIDTHTTWRDRLENGGGQVMVLGDQVKIVIPSSMLFRGMTPELSPSAYRELDLVAQYLRSFDKLSVKVAAYTNATGPAVVDKQTSDAQAKAVARYLWLDGVKTRLMVAQGYGGSRLVAKNSYDWNAGDNYRVEITAEKV